MTEQEAEDLRRRSRLVVLRYLELEKENRRLRLELRLVAEQRDELLERKHK